MWREPVDHAHKILTNPCIHMWKMEETRKNDNSCIIIEGLSNVSYLKERNNLSMYILHFKIFNKYFGCTVKITRGT